MRKKAYFNLMFAIYWFALFYCGVCRGFLRLNGIDPRTGFYLSEDLLVRSVNLVLGLALVGLFLLNALKPVEHDYPVYRKGRWSGLFAVLTGVAIFFYAMETGGYFLPGPNAGIVLGGNIGLLCTVLGLLAAVSFLWCGLLAFFSPDQGSGGLLLLSGVWMLVLLVCKFNQYTTLTTISDNLLAVLFMVFASLFLVGHARTHGGFQRKDGRNYTISAGLCVSLCGMLLAVPNLLYLWVNRTTALPALALGSMECLFVLVMSVYALIFVNRLCSSIQTV